jgi:hypothetical protein
MNEQDVRALVREAIARHIRPSSIGVRPSSVSVHTSPGDVHTSPGADRRWPIAEGRSPIADPSHTLLAVLPGSEVDDGMCVIEPAVRCNHCGFCQSVGY